MSKNTKFKQYSVVAVLVVVALALAGLIYTSTQGNDSNSAVAEDNNQNEAPNVEEIDVEQTDKVVDEVEDDEVVVEAIDKDQDEVVDVVIDESNDDVVGDTSVTEAEVIVVETIEEPVAEEPEKPAETPPEEQPETDDDLTNPDVVPEYDEEEVTYTPEVEDEEPVEEVRGSNQVPDSENPFLQDDIPSNGDGGEQQGSNYYQDGNKAGEGDKF